MTIANRLNGLDATANGAITSRYSSQKSILPDGSLTIASYAFDNSSAEKSLYSESDSNETRAFNQGIGLVLK